MEQDAYLEIYHAGNENAAKLLKAATLLCDEECFAQAYLLAYTALEEISKSQYAADVFTRLRTEEGFQRFYRDHHEKIAGVGWAHEDANAGPYRYKWVGPDMDDIEAIDPEKPIFAKRQMALYVDVNFETGALSKPSEVITERDARGIIHIGEVALQRIWEITGEFGGGQIGTKGFMK